MSLLFRAVLFLFLFLFLFKETRTSGQDFFEICKATRCSENGPEIRYPFRLNTQPTSCGLKGFQLSCLEDDTDKTHNKTLLHLPRSDDYYVQEISYLHGTITIVDSDHDTVCPLQSLLSLNLSGSTFNKPTTFQTFLLVNCTERVSWTSTDETVGPISCMSHDRNFVYLVNAYAFINNLPLNCYAHTTATISTDLGLRKGVEKLLETREIRIGWQDVEGCIACEKLGSHCGFNSTRNATICSAPRPKSSSHGPIIIGTSVGGTIFIALVILFFFYRVRKSDKEKETQIKIEKFLADYKTLSPIRYTYSNVKKITSGFKHKLGQGGYGSVYRGKLLNGIPVAVKMLENSEGDGKEFMNEVSTIGRIHHFNVVRLFGYCSEVSRRALIYEYLPNESLEKFISSKEASQLSWEKMKQIAIGIARGIEYLHQGCNQRILHFDIKPHNILLDHNFQPKISDFGLAKLCSKEQSVVSMTAARGTAGYMAPELFSRNFGEVSYKSDVYSFGTLLLEMVKNTNVRVENESEINFSEWIYNRISQGEELGLEIEVEGDEEMEKKLAIVALWCIQWNPTDRPSMSMVLQMLEGDSKLLEMPPKPFVSSDIEMVLA